MGERYVCIHTRVCKLPFTSPRALARCLSSAAARLPQPPLEMVAQMDDKNRALCFFYRNPPNGAKRLTYAEIAEIVRNEDGGHPSEGAVRQCTICGATNTPKWRFGAWLPQRAALRPG